MCGGGVTVAVTAGGLLSKKKTAVDETIQFPDPISLRGPGANIFAGGGGGGHGREGASMTGSISISGRDNAFETYRGGGGSDPSATPDHACTVPILKMVDGDVDDEW